MAEVMDFGPKSFDLAHRILKIGKNPVRILHIRTTQADICFHLSGSKNTNLKLEIKPHRKHPADGRLNGRNLGGC